MGAPLPPEVQNYPQPPAPPAPPVPPQYQPPSQPPASPKYFTEDDIEKARREERDKLYGRISKTDDRFKTLQEELDSLKADRDKRVAEEEHRRQEAEAALRAKNEEEMSAKDLIAQREKEWQTRLDEIQAEGERRDAAYKRDQEFMRLQSYIQRRAAEEQDRTIGAELIDFITGNTEAEVEESIKLLQAKTQRIIEGMRDGQVTARAAQPGISPTGQPPSGGPLDALTPKGNQPLTKEEIEAIPMSEWHIARQKLGIAGAGTNRGLMG